MTFKRSAPIAFYARVDGPATEADGVDAASAATARVAHQRDISRVEDALRAADPRLASGTFGEDVDEFGREEYWFRVEHDGLVFSKRDLHVFAEAVRAVDTDHTVYLWIQDDDDNEHGLEVFRNTIKPDAYRRD